MCPVEPALFDLRRLSAEVRADLEELKKLVAEAGMAQTTLGGKEPSTLEVYGAGKLLHDFYTGIERTLVRIASVLGGIPSGPAWHRTLLEDAALTIEEVRPPILRVETRDMLGPFLRFRHLFRNLYAFTLQAERIQALLGSVDAAWAAVQDDLRTFVAFLDGIRAPRPW